MEAALSCFGAGRSRSQPSGTATLGADAEAASPDFVCYAQTAQGWFHAVELPQARRGVGRQQGCRPRVWKEAGLKPHRLDRYMASDDPDFETKAADIIGLYLNPPQHAAVFCVDEKTAIPGT